MQIRRKLQLASLALVIGAAAIVLAVTWTLRQADREVDAAGLYTEIEEKCFSLAILTTNFQLEPSERRVGQWREVHASMGELLSGLEARAPSDAFYLDSIRKRHQDAGGAFERFIQLRSNTSADSLSAEQTRRTSDVMRVNLLQLADEAKLLVSSSMDRAVAEEHKATVVTVTLLGALVALSLGSAMLTSATIARSLAALAAGVRAVEAGNLDHRVGLDSRDEFGELAAGFDRMSGRLKASQDRLSLQAEELRRANDDLQAAYKELEAFSYSVSHDLRAPLRTIEGFSQIVLETYEDRLDERGRDYLQRIRRAVVRMEALIDDILRLSRLSRASMVLERVDLTGLAKSVVEGLREQEPDRRVAVDIEDGLAASGDRELLRAVLDNLLGNAWKFTRGREDARIEMGALRGDGEAIFYIRDNGAGFNPAYADKLFKPFQRLHSEREFPGTGIGLALVHRIVARHGGSVRAEGAAGQGATFTFSLPTMESARERTDDPARRG